MRNNELRQEMKTKRRNLSDKEIINRSKIIEDKLYPIIKASNVKDILCFYPLPSEVNLLGLYDRLIEEGYILYFPVTYRDNIRFYRVNILDDFEQGSFNVYEPINRAIEFKDKEAIAITPGLVFDKNNNRIGYGRAYYDRFLRSHQKTTPVGVCFCFQIVDEVDAMEWDVPMKQVICDD